jgi:hypothetical protein
MSEAFFDFVRGRSDSVPPGYAEVGMYAYRYLVYLGASQMIHDCYPDLREQLGAEAWQILIEDFIRRSAWRSHFYGDLCDEFQVYLRRASGSAHD